MTIELLTPRTLKIWLEGALPLRMIPTDPKVPPSPEKQPGKPNDPPSEGGEDEVSLDSDSVKVSPIVLRQLSSVISERPSPVPPIPPPPDLSC